MASSFFIITAVMTAVFDREKATFWHVLVFCLKFGLVMLAIGVLILVYDINSMGILIGVSLVLPSIVLESILKLARSGEA